MSEGYSGIRIRTGVGEFVSTSTDDWEDRYIKAKEGDVTMVEIEEYDELRGAITHIEREEREKARANV